MCPEQFVISTRRWIAREVLGRGTVIRSLCINESLALRGRFVILHAFTIPLCAMFCQHPVTPRSRVCRPARVWFVLVWPAAGPRTSRSAIDINGRQRERAVADESRSGLRQGGPRAAIVLAISGVAHGRFPTSCSRAGGRGNPRGFLGRRRGRPELEVSTRAQSSCVVG